MEFAEPGTVKCLEENVYFTYERFNVHSKLFQGDRRRPRDLAGGTIVFVIAMGGTIPCFALIITPTHVTWVI